MPHRPHRTSIAFLAVVLAVTPAAACGSGPPPADSPTPATSLPRTISPQPQPSNSPTATTPATSAPAGTPPSTGRPPAGAGLRGRTVVLNCPADRGDPPCPATPVPARIVVLDQAGKTVLTTVDTDADGTFTVTLPAGHYQIRAARTGGNTARRPTIRPVTVTAGRYTTVTVRLITGLS